MSVFSKFMAKFLVQQKEKKMATTAPMTAYAGKPKPKKKPVSKAKPKKK